MSILKTRWTSVSILVVALLLRVLLLGIKPPHFDEGVNGWFVDQITKNGFFHYDPTNYHGPLHFYVLFLSQTLFGRSVWALRMPIVLVSTATVGLVLLFERFLGRRVCEWAALAMAVSPAMVFYGRYAIHESWLVLFLILTLFGLAGLWRFGAKSYLWTVTIGLTGMVLTKETYIIHVVSFVLAALCLKIWELILPSSETTTCAPQEWTRRDLLTCVLTGLLLILFFYSGTFLDFKSLPGLYQTYAAWFHTGEQGHGHEKPFVYWIKPLMMRYEWVALLGLAGCLYLFLAHTNQLMRYIGIYACGSLVAYSIVHYKTPWCIVSLLWPFFFVFGYLAVKLAEKLPRISIAVCAVVLCVSLGRTASLNFVHYTDEAEPYVYVQTLPDIFKLTQPLQTLTEESPENYHLDAHILLSSYHPLPWLLGDFTNIGYYEGDRKPNAYDADFLLVEQSRIEEVEKALKEDYFTEQLQLRGSQDPSKLYLNAIRFGSVFPKRKPELMHAKPLPSAQPR